MKWRAVCSGQVSHGGDRAEEGAGLLAEQQLSTSAAGGAFWRDGSGSSRSGTLSRTSSAIPAAASSAPLASTPGVHDDAATTETAFLIGNTIR